MTRYPDWRVRLNQYLDEFFFKGPVEEVNCALFANGAVQAMTGEDLLEDIGHLSPEELFEKAKEMGFESPEDAIASRMEKVDSWRLAMVGDIALVRGNAFCLGVVTGAEIKVLRVDGTAGAVPLSHARMVFRP